MRRWISASVAVGAAMFALIGLMTLTSGVEMSFERTASSSIDHAKAMNRSGTLAVAASRLLKSFKSLMVTTRI